MITYEKPDDRFMFLLSAGNLSISQSVCEVFDSIEYPLWNGGETQAPLLTPLSRNQPLNKISSPHLKKN